MKKNEIPIFIYIVFIIGFVLFAFLSYNIFKTAFETEYVQIVGIVFGCFFGIFALLLIAGAIYLFFFYNEEDERVSRLESAKINQKKTNNKKWTFIVFFPILISLGSFYIAIRNKSFNEIQYNPKDYIALQITQTNKSEVYSVKGSEDVIIMTKEYPGFKFHIGSIGMRVFDKLYYLRNVNQGDLLEIWISKDEYFKKITKQKPLTFSDKTINYNIIGIYGIEHQKTDILSFSNYVEAGKQEYSLNKNVFFVIGIIFIVIQLLIIFIRIRNWKK